MNHDNDDNDNDEKFTLDPQERGKRLHRKMERASILLRSLILTQK